MKLLGQACVHGVDVRVVNDYFQYHLILLGHTDLLTACREQLSRLLGKQSKLFCKIDPRQVPTYANAKCYGFSSNRDDMRGQWFVSGQTTQEMYSCGLNRILVSNDCKVQVAGRCQGLEDRPVALVSDQTSLYLSRLLSDQAYPMGCWQTQDQ